MSHKKLLIIYFLRFDAFLAVLDRAIFDVAGVAEAEVGTGTDAVDARRVAPWNASEDVEVVLGVSGLAGALVASVGLKADACKKCKCCSVML